MTIFTTQIADVFGLDFGGEKVPGDFVGKWLLYFRHFGTVDWGNAAVSVLSVLIIALSPKFSKKIPGSLIAIVVVTVGVYFLKRYGGIEGIDTIGDRFTIRPSLPGAAVPELNWEAIKNLFPVDVYKRQIRRLRRAERLDADDAGQRERLGIGSGQRELLDSAQAAEVGSELHGRHRIQPPALVYRRRARLHELAVAPDRSASDRQPIDRLPVLAQREPFVQPLLQLAPRRQQHDHAADPVSYTHLDVYKRQAFDKHGREVFLADTSYALSLAQEKFPDIRFHFTSEF